MANVKDSIGLDLGSAAVRAAHIVSTLPAPSLINVGQVEIPPGAIREGEVFEPAVVAQALGQLWKRAGFTSKKVSLGIANQKVVARHVDLPYLAEKELKSALHFQVQEHIPMRVEDAVLDYQFLGEFITETNERMMRLLLVAAQKDMINSMVSTVESAGLTLEAIDFAPLGLVRSVGSSEPSAGNQEGEAVIDLGSGLTNVVVHESGVPRFARVLSSGGDQITSALANELEMTREDAESVKRVLGLAPASGGDPMIIGSVEGVGHAQMEQAAKIVERRAGEIIEEIRSSFNYYSSQGDSGAISRVLLTGGGSRLTNMADRLGAALRLPIEASKAIHRLQTTKLRLTEEQMSEAEPLMGSAIGTALGAFE